MAVDLLEQRLVGHAAGPQVVVAGGGLGEAIALLPAAGEDDAVGEAVLVELQGVVEPVLQHRGGLAVVLGGAEHDDRRRPAGRRHGGWPGTPARR